MVEREKIGIRLSEHQIEAIDRIAAQERRTRSETIRLMLADQIEARSFGASAEDWRLMKQVQQVTHTLVSEFLAAMPGLIETVMSTTYGVSAGGAEDRTPAAHTRFSTEYLEGAMEAFAARADALGARIYNHAPQQEDK